jgi:formylglycine-generating enzyme required for sulfatase activity
MEDYRFWANPMLKEEFQRSDREPEKKLHASLALLPVDPDQVEYLYDRLLDGKPEEVRCICEALRYYKDKLQERLWSVVEQPERWRGSQRMRAAFALADYDPVDRRWEKVSSEVVEQLVAEETISLPLWRDGFQPVKAKLVSPLETIFRGETAERGPQQSVAAFFLAEYAQPEELVDLLMDSDEKQFAALYPKIKGCGERALEPLQRELGKEPFRDTRPEDKDKLARRKAAAAVALLRMGKAESVWPLLKHGPDPAVRSYLIHRLSPMDADPRTIITRLEEEKEVFIRRALLLSLGEFSPHQISLSKREVLVPQLLDWYRDDADPGIHGALEWLLRRWNQREKLGEIDREWIRQSQRNSKGVQNALARDDPNGKPQWFVNGQGQTMVVVPGPVAFTMGSPAGENGRRPEAESQHGRRIGRTFAIATKPVTVEQFRLFLRKVHNEPYEIPEYAPTGECPAIGVTWYRAAEYCNWLSKEEGLPEMEWCYQPNSKGEYEQGMKLAANYLSRTGYRLPTEAEWEYACRAEAVTSRFYGESDDLLAKYGWCVHNSRDHTWPVGSLKPNDLGLFDMHGHVWTWCQERYHDAPGNPETEEDKEDALEVVDTEKRVLRGVSFDLVPKHVRCANRVWHPPTECNFTIGFRPAKTLRAG